MDEPIDDALEAQPAEQAEPLEPAAPLTVDAVYAAGVLRPASPLALPEGTHVRLVVTPTAVPEPPVAGARSAAAETAQDATATAAAPGSGAGLRGRWAALGAGERLAWLLFGAGMLLYVATRLWRIADFPVYFFVDEASQTIFARRLAEAGFRDPQGHPFPLYFEVAAGRMAPLLSVYLNYVTMTLFGQSVVVTRATTAVVTCLGALALAFILKRPLGVKAWWLGPVLLATVPAWFIHSRSGFETVMMAACYAMALLCYLLYRTARPAWLYGAVLFAALAFYLYSNGQAVVVVTALLLAISDLRYHRRHGRTVALACLLAVALAVPFLRFEAADPGAMGQHLRIIGSYLYDSSLSPADKVLGYLARYGYGLSPEYWFRPDDPHDLLRHRLQGHGHIDWWLLPFVLLGVLVCLRRWRSSPHRAILLVTLATPVGAALADVGITRVLSFVVPAVVLAALGLELCLDLLGRRVSPRLLSLGTFAVFALAGVAMTADAVTNGVHWTDDYGLYGLQWGARQLFEDAVPEILAAEPKTQIQMTSEWANGADNLPYFFLNPEQRSRVVFRSVVDLMIRRGELTPDMLFVMTENERQRAEESGKFEPIQPERVINYPNGKPGFVFARLAYRPGVDEAFAREREERRAIVPGTAEIDGQTVSVRHSKEDMGRPQDMFDGDPFTLLRGMEANPLVIELTFPEPRPIRGLAALFAHMPFTLGAELYAPGATEPVTYTQSNPADTNGDVTADLSFDHGPALVERLRLTVKNDEAGDIANIHVRDLKFR